MLILQVYRVKNYSKRLSRVIKIGVAGERLIYLV